MKAPRRVEAGELMVGLAVVLVYTGVFAHWDLLVDDAFISFRYADHLRQFGELVYNPGERVEGISNLLWTLLIGLLGAGGIDPVHAGPGLGYVAGLGAVLLTVRAARVVLGLGALPAWLGGALCAVNASFSFWAASGLETPLFAALLLATWVALEQTRTPWSAARLGVLGVLLGLTRPEGMLVALGLPGVLLIRRAPVRVVLTAILVTLLPLAALELWRLGYYGVLIPNAVVAKLGLSTAGLVRGARYLGDFLVEDRLLWLLPLILVSNAATRARPTLGLFVLFCAVSALVAGGDGLYRYRLAAHALPLLALGAAAAIDRIVLERPRLGVLLAVGSVAIVAEPLLEHDFFAGRSLAAVQQWEARWTRVGRALGRVAPPDATLATNVAGRVPYYSRLPTLDLLGLTDPAIAHSKVYDYGRGYAGHERAAPEVVLSRGPEIVYLSVLDGLPAEVLADPSGAARVLASGSLYRYAPLVEHREWRARYRVALLRLEDGSSAGLYVLRGSRTERAEGGALRWVD